MSVRERFLMKVTYVRTCFPWFSWQANHLFLDIYFFIQADDIDNLSFFHHFSVVKANLDVELIYFRISIEAISIFLLKHSIFLYIY